MRYRIMTVAMILFLSVSTVFGADIDGKWTGKYDAGMGEPMDMEYTFKANGNVLTGTTIGGPGGEQVPITDGKIDGNKISFSVAVDMMGQEMKIDFTGELSGDKLNLNFDMGGMFDGSFAVQRAK